MKTTLTEPLTAPRILVVEDEGLVGEEIRQRLLRLGCTVVGVVASGEEAISLAEETRPDLILMDVRLQGQMDGIAAAEAITDRRKTPVVFLTAHSDATTLERARNLAPFGYVIKPFFERDLQVAIEIALARSRAEAQLRASEHRYATTLAGIADGVLVTDEAGQVTYMNPVAEQLTAWPREEAVGRPVCEVLTLSDERTGQPILNLVEQIRQRTQAVDLDNQTLLHSRDQGQIPVDYLAAPLHENGNGCTGMVVIFRDVRARRQAQAALKDSEARFRSFMDHCPAVAFIKDEQGRYLYANRPWEKQFSTPRTDWLGKTDFDFWPKETAARFRATDQQALRTVQLVQKSEQGRTEQGEERRWLTFKFPLTDVLGQPLVGGFMLDVTEKEQTEERLRQAQKMEVIGHLAGGVAHDFNNLLTVIIGYAAPLVESLPPDSPLREPLEQILGAGERAADLTRQLLAFGRKQILQPRVVNLNAIIQGFEKLVRRLLPENIQITTDRDPDLGLVQIDPGQFEQVILNLVVNARDAMPQGGSLTLTTQQVRIESRQTEAYPGLPPGSYARFTVADTGFGMDETTQRRLFEPFFTTKELGKGTGLGLATVYGIVKQSGGWIYVTSAVGRGATFTLLFPTVVAPPTPQELERAEAAERRGTETLLLVEDNDFVRRLASVVLQERGYVVLEASDGVQAQARVADYSGPLHGLISDVILPRLSGPALVAQLAQQHPRLKVLFMSGYECGQFQGQLPPGVTTAFLQKPFRPMDLAASVRKLLDQA
jgi:PAS domain S-box-containing protein